MGAGLSDPAPLRWMRQEPWLESAINFPFCELHCLGGLLFSCLGIRTSGIIKTMLARAPMTDFKMTYRAECAVSACSSLPLCIKTPPPHPANCLWGMGCEPLDRSLASPHPIQNKANFRFYQPGLFYWLLSSEQPDRTLGCNLIAKSSSPLQGLCSICCPSSLGFSPFWLLWYSAFPGPQALLLTPLFITLLTLPPPPFWLIIYFVFG